MAKPSGHGGRVQFAGEVLRKESKVSKKSGQPYFYAAIGWVGGESGDLFLRAEEFERFPPVGQMCAATFEAKAGQDGIRTGALVDVKAL